MGPGTMNLQCEDSRPQKAFGCNAAAQCNRLEKTVKWNFRTVFWV